MSPDASGLKGICNLIFSFAVYHNKATFKKDTANIHIIYIPLTLVSQNNTMIISFGSKHTEQIWNGIRVKKFPNEIQNVARRKLRMLNNSLDISDLRIPPSNRLEKLTGKLKEFYSIRINKQWRIIFIWGDGNASEVEIIDYH